MIVAVRWITGGLVVGAEVALYVQYAALGAQFHFWLHALVGAAVGLGIVAASSVGRDAGPADPWLAGLVGHLFAAAPDVLFLTVGVLHVPWMDVFAGHISVHFVPRPLLVGGVLFTLAVGAWTAVALEWRRTAILLLGAGMAVAAVAVALRAPIPGTLDEVRHASDDALLCPLGRPGGPQS